MTLHARAALSEALAKIMTVERSGDDEFLGEITPPENSLGRDRVYGGLVVAQALAAAEATVPAGRPATSFHCRFLRSGNENIPIRYRVERDLDGGSVSQRRVVADQGGAPIFTCSVMMRRPAQGPRVQPRPPEAPDPEAIGEIFEGWRGELPYALGKFLRAPRLVQLLPVDYGALDSKMPFAGPFRLWVRLSVLPAVSGAMARVMLAYASDAAMLLSAALRHGLVSYRNELRASSLDHMIWFHEDFRADDWLLYTIDSPWSGDERALTQGRFFTRDGRLVASTAQEGLLRLSDPAAHTG